jgi:hypothetical protein
VYAEEGWGSGVIINFESFGIISYYSFKNPTKLKIM